MYALAPASRLPAGSQHIAVASCSTRCPPDAWPCAWGPAPMYPRGCAHQHLPPHSILPCVPGEQGLAWLEACSSPLAPLGLPQEVLGGEAGLPLKRHISEQELRPSGERGRRQNTALSGGEPSFLLFSLFIVMSWRSSWRARVRPTQAFSS